MAGEIIRQGDSTSHGGKVLEGLVTDICHGKPIAYIGHKVSCPKCSGTHTIVEGVMTTTFYGKGVAVAGMKTSCGATLIASQFTDIIEVAGGGAGSSSAKAAVASAAAATAAATTAAVAIAAAAVAKAAARESSDDKEKKVTKIYWSYGRDETPVTGFSRFYVDLNLHVETENYAAGDKVDIELVDAEGKDIIDGVKKLTLSAAVGANGKAKLMNALAGKTVVTVAQTETA
jgi:uncharacterized Zn-binding protein involved in type VI secretion